MLSIIMQLTSVIFIVGCLIVSTSGGPVASPDPNPDPEPAINIEDDPAHNVQLLKYSNENIGVDGYNFAFETSDGVSRQETATLKNPGTENEAISVQGTVTWVSPDGIHYTLNYLADENGFQPEGAHLPVGPEAA